MPKYEDELLKLYSAQAQISEDPYLQAHYKNRAVIRRQIAIFERCQEFLKDAHTVLDWGCHQAVPACMVRMLRGMEVDLHGCDVVAGDYPAFYDFARLTYSQICHPYLLPYEDSSFDVVFGSGVLEHVPNASESLKELYRIIRPGGYFIMTMLPNKYSYTERIARSLGRACHLRTYSLGEAKQMFIGHGFFPVRYGHHQLLPTLAGPKGSIHDFPLANRIVEKLFSLNSFGERLWPINKLASNIFIVGKKLKAIDWEEATGKR
jgi:SAM-dependent methyltransferase